MTTRVNMPPRKRWPAIILVLVTLLVLVLVIRLVDGSPRTDDAYAYADTIDVVPEVSGRIVQLAVRDNQAVKQGDLLFQIDPRPYEDALVRGRAALVALDRQIELTQRSVSAQQYTRRPCGRRSRARGRPRLRRATRCTVPSRC
jgi:multidrug efflux system membrane fusion protein